MYDARTRETYVTLFKVAEAALMPKFASILAPVLAAHPDTAVLLKPAEK